MAQHPWRQVSRDHLRRVALREVGLVERDILLDNERIGAGGSSVRSVLRRTRRVSTLRWSRPGRRRIHGTARIRRLMRRSRGHGRPGAGSGRTKGRSSLGRRGGEVRRVACAWPRGFVNRVTPETGRIAGRPVTEHASQDPIPETVNAPDLPLDASRWATVLDAERTLALTLRIGRRPLNATERRLLRRLERTGNRTLGTLGDDSSGRGSDPFASLQRPADIRRLTCKDCRIGPACADNSRPYRPPIRLTTDQIHIESSWCCADERLERGVSISDNFMI